jgi:hypothetical protein
VLIGSSNAIFQTDTGGESAGAWRGSDLLVLEDGRVRGRGFAGTVAERVQFSRNVRKRMRLAAFDAANIMHSEDGYGYEFSRPSGNARKDRLEPSGPGMA